MLFNIKKLIGITINPEKETDRAIMLISLKIEI